MVRAAYVLVLAFGTFGCTNSKPDIIEASFLAATEDPSGPYQVRVLVHGGDAPVTVRVLITDQGEDALEDVCGLTLGGHARNVDTGLEPGRCLQVELQGQGDLFEGHIPGRPFTFDSIIHYRFVATDGDGERALWPVDGAGQFVVGPNPVPELIDLAPRTGPAAGGTTVLLRGERFSPGVIVRFGDEDGLDVVVESPHLIEVVTPPGPPGMVDVQVIKNGQSARLIEGFRYQEPPRIDRIDPDHGPVTAETTVVITGAGFEPSAVVAFGDGEPRIAEVLSTGRLVVEAPPHPAGVVDVSVTNSDGQQAQAIQAFTYWPAPILISIDPEQGTDAGGTQITLTGELMRSPGTVFFGERRARNVQVADDGRTATCVTPPHPDGVVDVRFFNPDGQMGELPDVFRFAGPPVLDDAEPGEISRCGGGITTLIGRNFEMGMQVFFGEQAGEVIEISDDGTRATVRAPAGAPGPVRVRVINPDGRGIAADDLVVYGIQPVVRSVAPVRVPVWGGINVVIEGGDFEAGLAVTFDGVPAETINLLETGCSARLEVRVPAHDAGLVDVVVSNADESSARLVDGLEYVGPVLDPDTGLLPGFGNLVLRGVDLRPGLVVRFNGRAPREIERVSDEEWRILTPPGVGPGAVTIEVRNAGGRGVELPGGFAYTVFQDRTQESLQAIGDCNALVIGDIDADGDQDVITANGALGNVGIIDQPVAVQLNNGQGRFEARELRPDGNGMNVDLADIDGDGDDDLLVANLGGGRNELFRNEGGGRLVNVPGFIAVGPSYDASFVDVDADGDPDVFLLQTGDPNNNAQQGPEQLFLNDGRGNLVDRSEGIYFGIGDVHDHDFAHGDLNGDGLPDMVITVDNLSQGFLGSENRLLINQGGGRYERVDSPLNQFRGDWLHAELVDIDEDGDLDVLMPQDFIAGFSQAGTPAIAVFLNDGQANFEFANDRIIGMPLVPAFGVSAGDLDGDGDVDLSVAVFGILFSDGSIEAFRSVILLNDGSGVFHEASSAFAEGLLIASAEFGIADFNGDGKVDLFECAARGESRVWIQTTNP